MQLGTISHPSWVTGKEIPYKNFLGRLIWGWGIYLYTPTPVTKPLSKASVLKWRTKQIITMMIDGDASRIYDGIYSAGFVRGVYKRLTATNYAALYKSPTDTDC